MCAHFCTTSQIRAHNTHHFFYCRFHFVKSHGAIGISFSNAISGTMGAKMSSVSILSMLGGSQDKSDTLLTTCFFVSTDFGRPGVILLDNHDNKEFYLKSITLEMPDNTQIYFPCHTWINHSKLYFGQSRIFFTNDVSCILSPLSSLSLSF